MRSARSGLHTQGKRQKRTYLWLAEGSDEERLDDIAGLVGMAYVLEGLGRVLACRGMPYGINTRRRGNIHTEEVEGELAGRVD